ncbi:hypothetical protein M9434_003121 [Picochlorum sp. BPE23]|nr:hypothetical protein M9434_003121 [Picochlorum sp. BPE23]
MCQQQMQSTRGSRSSSRMKKSANTHPKQHAAGESNGATENQNGASHVSVVVSKKIRNAKKRLAKAEEIQRKADSGKELNDDQQLALKHVDRVKGLIEELEKLCGVLDEAVEKDVQVAVEKKEQQMVEEMERVMREKEVSSKNAIKAAVKRAKAEGVNRVKQLERKMEAERKSAMVEGAQKMVEFLYMSALFDPFMPYQVEKTAVMNFMKESGDDCVDVDAQRAMAERLDMIGVLGKMMTSQPLHAGLSHEEGVTQCQEIAKQYIDGDDGEVLNGTMTRAEVVGLVERVKGLGYYKVPVAPPVSAAVPPPPPPPMEPHISEYHTFPEYVTPEAAAATGQNVLNQFFAAPVQPGLDAAGYDGLGMHEVVEEHREMQHTTVVEPQHYQQPQSIQAEEKDPGAAAVMNVEEEERSRQIMRSNRTRKQVYYKNNSKKKNSNHGAWKESALVNDSGSNTRKFHRGKKYGQQHHKHREQDTRV